MFFVFLLEQNSVVKSMQNTKLYSGSCAVPHLIPSVLSNRTLHKILEIVHRGIVYPKMKILSSFTHSQAAPNLNKSLCSAEHKYICMNVSK